jgi:hypothetical protein
VPRYSDGDLLVDDAGTLTDRALTHPAQRRQVELPNGHRRHELHRRALHRLDDRLRVAEVVLLPLRIGANVFRGHQTGIVTERHELATEVMSADAGLDTDQARQHVGEP